MGGIKMAMQQNPYSLRVDPVIMDKIRFIASENGRSVNKEIESLMKAAVKRYEAENGPISTAE